MKHTLTLTLATWSDGSLNDEGSLKAFQKAYEEYKAETEASEKDVHIAVHSVFDMFRGEAIPMPALIHQAINRLNVGQNFQVMHDKVQAFIRENSDLVEKKDRKTGKIIQYAEPQRTRAFGIRKGKGGGCSRWSDVPEGKE